HRFDPDAPLYLGVQLHGADLHLSEHFGDATPGSSIRLRIEDLPRYRAQLVKAAYPNANPSITEQPWGLDMPISDPFGNRIIFCQE
nr:VOC family protein [Gammaproteobacteria bacterium]